MTTGAETQGGATDQQTAAGTQTDAGQNQGGTGTGQQGDQQQQQQQQGAATETAPLFVAKNQDELNAKFGQTREEGRLSVAKANGFDTVEEFNTAMASWKQAHEASLTDQQKAEEAQRAVERERDALKLRVATQEMAGKQKAIAERLGLDPAKLDRVERYRDKNAAEINADGTINESLVEHSMTMFLTQNPEFKAPVVTVGQGGNPADAAADKNSLDARIQEATNKGDIPTAISLELQKMFQPAV